jgi:hypothetical protein
MINPDDDSDHQASRADSSVDAVAQEGRPSSCLQNPFHKPNQGKTNQIKPKKCESWRAWTNFRPFQSNSDPFRPGKNVKTRIKPLFPLLSPVQEFRLAHATAQKIVAFALMCASVHLRAPSCGKMKKSQMVHKPHTTAHPNRLHQLAPSCTNLRYLHLKKVCAEPATRSLT